MNELSITPSKLLSGAFALCVILGFASLAIASPPLPDSIQQEYNRYFPSTFCRTCHQKIVDQHSQSYHAKSFSDPVFKGQYFKELLPQAEKDPELYQEAKACIACHSPIDFIVLTGRIFSEEQVNPGWSGVGCVFCHTITGYDGETPGNGNYISEPDQERVLGPFIEKSDWHHVYSELHTKSEVCAICHNAFNRHGLEIKSTYTEWKNSLYAEKRIQCQNCHMNTVGFLLQGKPVYEWGCAVSPSSLIVRAPERSKLYTHLFPGAHSKTQILGTGVITLNMETKKPLASPGDEIIIYIFIDNSRTGHKMPSGSADLRQLWLELEACNGDMIMSIPALSLGVDTYDVTGKGPFDQEILGEDIPKGTRIYRAIFVDKAGIQTLSSYNAVRIAFDNRLNASELRLETYYFKVPKDFKGKLTLRASLNYLPYPSSFSRRFDLPKPESFKISSITKEIPLK
jgi:hypothetical protein